MLMEIAKIKEEIESALNRKAFKKSENQRYVKFAEEYWIKIENIDLSTGKFIGKKYFWFFGKRKTEEYGAYINALHETMSLSININSVWYGEDYIEKMFEALALINTVDEEELLKLRMEYMQAKEYLQKQTEILKGLRRA